MAQRKIQGYGWIPDLPDARDRAYTAPPPPAGGLPPSADLRANCPPVYSQGQLGSCTANAIAGALEFDQRREGLPQVFTPSRLFIYYNERAIQGTIGTDSGAQIRDGISSVASQGAPPESLWPYDPANFAMTPPSAAYRAALGDTALVYFRLNQDLDDFRGCLASGYPFVLGFTVYESFESQQVAQTGHASLPAPGEAVVGGHAVLAVGYDDANRWFLLRNSWGASWGMGGYFTLPYAYLTDENLSSDFWTIRVVR